MNGSESNDHSSNLETPQQRLAHFLDREFLFPAIDLYIEKYLNSTGILTMLEEEEIIPIACSKNPYDVESQEDAYDQWWTDNPEEFDEVEKKEEERKMSLKLVHTGIIIGKLCGYEFKALSQSPEEYLSQTDLISSLEDIGIVPQIEDPNPVDKNTSQDEYDKWWNENPEEYKAYLESIELRNRSLNILGSGVIIGKLRGHELLQGRNLPKTK